MSRITRIKGLSERRRLPRLGKIHLGVKAKSAKGTEYPTKTDYFVCPPEVQAVYGEKPRDLEVILPVNDAEQIFPQAYKCYRSGVGLWCSGNGETAFRVGTEKDVMDEVECPCELLEQKKCKQMGNLMIILPRVSLGGVYQIDTSSFNSIVDINSGLDFISDRNNGRLANVPCLLTLRPKETTVEGKKSTIYTMNLVLANHETIKRLQGQMTEIRSLLSGGAPLALPEPSPETDLIPGEIVETIEHEEAEETPAGAPDDFNPPRKVSPPPAPRKRQTPEEYAEMWGCSVEEAAQQIAQAATKAPPLKTAAGPVAAAATKPTAKPAVQGSLMETF